MSSKSTGYVGGMTSWRARTQLAEMQPRADVDSILSWTKVTNLR